ncbi:DUF2231 domain-containing protein [Sphingobium sp. YR768]|uniref:DUF2231 domain-containing protein n=1 Tax=Sphingobium sp. YR768 TaxID=1884365 RepID=UPI000B8711FC|nr:DUF2231 domain-containing protein [Sphingobium sp. YR768]
MGFRPFLHPLHGLLLAFPVALFTVALLTDIAYLQTAEIQWTNFSSWLIAGALLAGALVLVWSIILAIVARRRAHRQRSLIYAGLIAIMWIAGLVNAFKHSQDAWSSVGVTGLILSIISAVFALAASWVAHRTVREIAR